MTPQDTTCNENRAPSGFKAVLFDLDDTLYPQNQYVTSGFRAVSDYVHNLYGIHIFDELIALYQAGEQRDIFFKALQRHFKVVEEALLSKLLYVHRTHNPRIELYHDARVCLALLISRDIRVGLVAEGHAAIQRRKVAALELESLIDAIVYPDDLLGSRQSFQILEDAFQIMFLQLGLEPADIVFVGDNPVVDFYIPRKLGMGTVRIHRNKSEHANQDAPAPEFEPHVTIDSLCLLADVLQTANFKS
jgi:putative hydrolase of the HAD superfamily